MQDPDEIVLVAGHVRQLLLDVPLQVEQVASQATQAPLTSVIPSLQRQVLLPASSTLGSVQVRQ
jgi:hypothetical protein